MKQKRLSKKSEGRLFLRITAAVLLLTMALCACTKKPAAEPTEDTTEPETSQNAQDTDTSTQAEPVTLEQALLKERGKSYDQSDYKKFLGGEGIIDEYSEFDMNIDHSYSTTINDIVVSGGKVYFANFNMPLSNGQNIMEVGALAESGEVRYWHYTYDGEMGQMYFKSGTGYKVSCVPLSAQSLDMSHDPLFAKVYRYGADGKALEDCTDEFLHADKVYDTGRPKIVFLGDKVSLLFPGKYLDAGTTEWNWYCDMDRKNYIAFDLDLSAIGSETPVRLYNCNILMTNSAFYEIVYVSEPLDDGDEAAQLAPDGTASPYYPAAQHLNCDLGLRKINLLTNYYSDVRNISTGYVITEDFTMLPVKEVMAQGYTDYIQYDSIGFGRAYE